MTNKEYSGQCIHGIPRCDRCNICDGDSNERSVAEILERAGKDGMSFDDYWRMMGYTSGANEVLNKKLKPEDVCVVDVEKLEEVLKDYVFSIKEIVEAIANSNAVKFKEV